MARDIAAGEPRFTTAATPRHAPDAAADHLHAWLVQVAVLGIHVLDEALTGFLDFYNPFAASMRERLGWWPLPELTFGSWLAGLLATIAILTLLAPAVRKGVPGTRVISWVFAAVMFLNGVAHLAGSLYFWRWLPGATSAPLLLLASMQLARCTAARARR